LLLTVDDYFLRDQCEIEYITAFSFLRIMLVVRVEIPQRKHEYVCEEDVRNKALIIALEFVTSLHCRRNSRPVVIIILSVRACKPELILAPFKGVQSTVI